MSPVYLKKAAAGSAAPTNGSSPDVPSIVKSVIDAVRHDGDAAVRKYSEKFDKWSPASFQLTRAEIDHAISQVPAQTLADIREVQTNVKRFAVAQKESLKEFELETAPGVFLGQKNNPIECAGALVPFLQATCCSYTYHL